MAVARASRHSSAIDLRSIHHILHHHHHTSRISITRHALDKWGSARPRSAGTGSRASWTSSLTSRRGGAGGRAGVLCCMD